MLRALPRSRLNHPTLLVTLVAIVLALLLLLFCARAAGWTFRHTTPRHTMPASPSVAAAAR